MYRNILLCYDGTIEGRNALKEGTEMALSMGAHTHLLAILRSNGTDFRSELAESKGSAESTSSAAALRPSQLHNAQQQVAMQILREGIEWLKARHLDAQGQVVFGDPAGHIAACARTLAIDLIVVGHHRRGRLERWWSEDGDAVLLEIAPCSVLVAMGPKEAAEH